MTRLHLFFVLVLGLTACGEARGQTDTEPVPERTVPDARAVRVETATVRASTARLEVSLPGEVQGSRDALLAAALGGYVERVLVSAGDEVQRGQALVRVDGAMHSARLAQAQAELDYATRERARAESLEGTIADVDLDAARARETITRAALRTARVTASRGVIRAPFAGTVAAVDVEQGEVTAPGAPVLRLVQLDVVEVSLAVPDRDVVALREGMNVSVQTDARGQRFSGRIAHISPAADLQTRAFEVEVEVDNPDRLLLPGMIARVSLSEATDEQRIVLPQHVLVTGIDDNGVFVVEDGVARWQVVRLGSIVRDQVHVEAGLDAGATIVVTGHRELADGDRVLVGRTGVCCEAGRIAYPEAP